MEFAKQELDMVAQLVGNADEQYVDELSQLELVMVGGGFGDAILA